MALQTNFGKKLVHREHTDNIYEAFEFKTAHFYNFCFSEEKEGFYVPIYI